MLVLICFDHENTSVPKISLGICLPANCQTNYLVSVVNDVIRDTDAKYIAVNIPKYTCQFEENITDWELLDFVTV